MFQPKGLIASIIFALMGGLLLYVLTNETNIPEDSSENSIQKPKQTLIIKKEVMQLKSEAFENKGLIPAQFTCDGADVNPALEISDVPKRAQSLALIMDDPDVPKNLREDGMWDHWIVFNIPPNTFVIEQGNEPIGIHGQGTSGNMNYHGPCPPDGEHRYFFKLFALDTRLTLKEGVSKTEVEKAMGGHIIEQAELVGKYSR